ncbi:hypothetical protein LTS18_014701 [Coniosporium uncinatum]|uniref:Uncharacterized protein n=1 Tax=Coniosporium uncinatum TaxID=93489 RepID=A0ACC3DVN8_9PEZI|nr:hypothetical protein LTS18_014701 [Coniosporium uncinatum]
MSEGNVEKDLLSLDGGGIKGISSLLILNAVMTRVRAIEGRDLEQERLPKDYFDLEAPGKSDKGESILLRSYRPPVDAGPESVLPTDAYDTITIADAACATSAAPTYLPEVSIGGVIFWR